MSKKGPAGELEVGRLLTPWWQKLEPEISFVRSPGSGGWRHAQRFGARGDLMADPGRKWLWPFTLEIKRREAWSEEVFLLGNGSPVWKWWTQNQKAAADSGKRPMLWFRKNQHPSRLRVLALPEAVWFVMFDESVFNRLRLRGLTPPLVRFDAPRHTVVLTHAQLLWLPPRALLQACEEAA